MDQNKRFHTLTAGLLAALMSLWVFNAWAQPIDVPRSINAGDHQALADYYRAEAKALEDLSSQHERMRDLYQKNHDHYNRDQYQTMAHHCEDLRLQALQMSYQYEALAKQEEKLAQRKK